MRRHLFRWMVKKLWRLEIGVAMPRSLFILKCLLFPWRAIRIFIFTKLAFIESDRDFCRDRVRIGDCWWSWDLLDLFGSRVGRFEIGRSNRKEDWKFKEIPGEMK